MHRLVSVLVVVVGLACVVVAGGCGEGSSCEDVANHAAGIHAKEAAPEEQFDRKRMADGVLEMCKALPMTRAQRDCMMKATSIKEMDACQDAQ